MKDRQAERIEFFKQYLKQHNISCNCGGPQYGTGHSPDCTHELAWDTAMNIFDDENTVDGDGDNY